MGAPHRLASERHRRHSADPPDSLKRDSGEVYRRGQNSWRAPQRRNHSVDSTISALSNLLGGAKRSETTSLEVDHERAFNVLQAELEQRVPLIVRPIATPPAWKRPWAQTPQIWHGDCKDAFIPRPPSGRPVGVNGQCRPTMHRKGGQALEETSQESLPIRWTLGKSHDSPTRAKNLMSKVLQRLIPINMIDTLHQAEGVSADLHTVTKLDATEEEQTISEPINPRRPKDPPNVSAEIAAFRSRLSKSFGNLTRAFRAMRNAVTIHNLETNTSSAANPVNASTNHASKYTGTAARLTCAEFEWCVSAYLHHGDRRLAKRMFVALLQDGKSDIGLSELAQQSSRQGLMSFVEFRRLLLERHSSLPLAFRELEDYMETQGVLGQRHGDSGRSCHTIKLPQFIEASSFFGLDAQQASHFFAVMDCDGDSQLSLHEFLDALTHMPKEVLLHDLRQRLLTQYSSMGHAFRDLTAGGNRRTKMDINKFTETLSRSKISDVEAAEIFRIVDDDSSGDVSLAEFREAMRDVAPSTSIEGFWQRFAAEWPEIPAAARIGGAIAQQNAGALLLELLPIDLKHKCGVKAVRVIRDHHSVASADVVPETPSATLTAVTAEVFDALAALLDVSRSNAQDLFKVLAEAARPQRFESTDTPRSGNGRISSCSAERTMEVDIEDFLQELQLWTENTSRIKSGSFDRTALALDALAAGKGVVQQVLAPSKAAISAFKAQLVPPPAASQPAEVKHRRSRSSGRPRMLPKLPWQAFPCTPATSLTAVCP